MTSFPSRPRELLRECLLATRRDVVLSIASASVRQLAFLSLPWVLGRAVDDGLEGGSVAAAAGWVTVLAAVAAVEYTGMRGWQRWATQADARTAVWLRTRLLRAVFALDTETMRGRVGSDLITRATRDVEAVGVWVHGLATWAVIGITVVVLTPALGGLDPLLLGFAAITVPVLAAVNLVFPPMLAARAGDLARAHGARETTTEQLLSALLPLRGVGAEPLMLERHHTHSGRVTGQTLRLASVSALWEGLTQTIPQVAVVAGLLVGGLAVADGRITVGALTTFVLWMGTVSLAVNAAVARLGDRAEARVSADRITQILDLPRERSGTAVGPASGDLTVRGLTVPRPGRPPIGPLELVARPGEWVAVTGPTGAGKSTLLRAIAGLVPATGATTFGGVPLADLDPDEVFQVLGFVPEDPLLVRGTVRDNLTISGDHSPERLSTAAHIAGLDLALAGRSWDEEVGERGTALSGGQRQLVALARALLRDSPVLLLDDVTSALDADTEARVLDRLRAATADKAVVLAGHSDAVLARADRQIVLTGGAGSGEHAPEPPPQPQATEVGRG
ncbi:ABC transporter ATP-binding protein [Actinomadura syzygii]|uniref:ABC transporter ATP-binding protein n=1 Tax=Actinomadura syzygii TaxID=1427538 RepID=A0A5D0TRT2_9ACTN|nr:ABC transporter ATP-binding protein [Actinomadura syzygii]TYC07619.1 ABC transporter ATP-binding protein [Actinomadura syzygii]